MAFLAMVGLVALVPLAMAFSAVINGWVLTILWGWFIVPVFHLPALSIAQAIGVALVTGFLTRHYREQKKSSCEIEKSRARQVGEMIGALFFSPLFTLGVGWVVHRFL